MKTIICLCLALLLDCLLVGCDNSCCDCEADQNIDDQGNLRLIRNWDKLWEGLSKPEGLNVYFYSQMQDLHYQKVYTDTTNIFLGSGEYNVLAINDVANLSGMDNYSTAKLSMPYQKIENKYITSEVPMAVATSVANIYVDNYKTSELIIAPSPIVYIINFRFCILKDSLTANIKECQGALNGVVTSRMLSGKMDIENVPATLQFTTQETTKGTFDKQISTLGLSDSGNTLDIFIRCENGQNKNITIDLTGLFDFSLSPIQNCIIQLRVYEDLSGAVVDDIFIEDWQSGTNDNIDLQYK